jgi:hypothetical protein
MSYRVVVMVPAEDRPGEFEVCFGELRYTVKRSFIWFGRYVMDVSIAFGDAYTIKPLERKEDADLTAQMIYLAMRRLGVEVRVEEYLES